MRFFTIVGLLVILLLSILPIVDYQIEALNRYASVEVLLPKVEVVEGTNFNVRVLVNPNDIEVAGVQLDLFYDSSKLKLVEITEGDLFEGSLSFFSSGLSGESLGLVKNIYSAIMDPGIFTIKSSIFINLTFTALVPSQVSLELRNIIVGDLKGDPIDVSTVNSVLNIQKVSKPPNFEPVTDLEAIFELEKMGYNIDKVGLLRDYGEKEEDGIYGVDRSLATSQVYYDLLTGDSIAIFQQLSMVDANNDRLDISWDNTGSYFRSGENLFICTVNGLTTSIVTENDQPNGKKDGETLTLRPQLFLGKDEVLPLSTVPILLITDPFNSYYSNNVLEWDYGICKRYLRLIEGKLLGSWSFDNIPKDNILIQYNQNGTLPLNLGSFALDYDTEFITIEDFESFGPDRGPPYIIGDSMTFYPNPDPESTSVDGIIYQDTYPSGVPSWSTVRDYTNGIGVDSSGTGNQTGLYWASNRKAIMRSIFLFDTSALPNDANISSATLSLYGTSKDNDQVDPTICIYESNPATNTILVLADYSKVLTTALSPVITHAAWDTAGFNDFVLNPLGIANISKTGVSKFGAREAAHDVADSWGGINVAVLGEARFRFYTSEQGVGFKPTLIVYYSEALPVIPKLSGAHGSPGGMVF